MVNPKSGRFVIGVFCETLFHPHINGSRINNLIKELYSNNENFVFPVKEPYDDIRDNFLPIYLHPNLTV